MKRRIWLPLGLCVVLLHAAPRAQDAPPATPVTQAEQLLDQNQPKQALEVAKKAVAQEPANPNAWFVLARASHAAGDLDGAIKAGHKATEFPAVRASAFYNLACAYAVKGDKDDAFNALIGAKRAGFADRDLMASDADLASLRSDPRFQLPLERNYFTFQLKEGTSLPFSVDLPVGFEPGYWDGYKVGQFDNRMPYFQVAHTTRNARWREARHFIEVGSNDPNLLPHAYVRIDGLGEYTIPRLDDHNAVWHFIKQGSNPLEDYVSSRLENGQMEVRFFLEYKAGSFWPNHSWKRTMKINELRIDYDRDTKVLFHEDK